MQVFRFKFFYSGPIGSQIEGDSVLDIPELMLMGLALALSCRRGAFAQDGAAKHLDAAGNHAVPVFLWVLEKPEKATMPKYYEGLPTMFSSTESIRMLACQYRTDVSFKSDRKLLETYLKFKNNLTKKHSVLGLIGEIYDMNVMDHPLSTIEVEQMLRSHHLPALQLAKEQEAKGDPLDKEALRWIADEKRRLAAVPDDDEFHDYFGFEGVLD